MLIKPPVIFMLEYWQRTLDNIRQKIELHSIKVASEPTQLSDVNLKLFFISYRHFKSHSHSVSLGLTFIFMNILLDNLLLQLFYVFKTVRCYQCFVVFLSYLRQLLLLNHFLSLQSNKNLKKKINQPDSLT